MVKGLDKFREVFKNFSNNYVIIGGTACDVLLTGTDMKPRATDDIDMILIVENMTPEFGRAFWNFIKEGGYESGKRKRGEDKSPKYELYRFENGIAGYPIKIELLSRHSDVLGEPSGFHLEPIPMDDKVSSLSAIMMDDDYYNLTVRNSLMKEELRFASPVALICLKAKAFLNLMAEREAGRQVNSKDIKKHRNDVLKLVATSAFDEPIALRRSVYHCIQEYVGHIRSMLPNKSLEDALMRNSDDINGYLEVLENAFVIEEK